jgi:putative mRNA 3-end processing factor
VRCDCFITESTFGLPIYRWRTAARGVRRINAWWRANAAQGRASLLLGYSFGKAQRMLAGVDASIGPIVVHGAVEPLNRPTAPPAWRCRHPAAGRGDDKAVLRAPWWSRRRRCMAWPGRSAGRVPATMPSPAAGCSCAAPAAARAWTAASCSATMPTGRACSAPSAPPARACHRHPRHEAVMVRWLREQGLQAGAFRTEYGTDDAEVAA